MTTTPTLLVAKVTTPAGQQQIYQFYYLVPAVDAAGETIQIRQQVAQASQQQLQTQVDKATAFLALIAAMPA